jgi:hypothetical protein
MKRKVRPDNYYPYNWAQISQDVKDAANWHCVRCGHAHDIPAGYMLTVHHLDGRKNHCPHWNLAALCQRCHLVVQAKVIMERNWMFDHTPWFRPYAAAYYGVRAGLLPDTNNYFDGLLLVRPQFVETWTSYLLSLGKPQVIGA